MQQLLDSLTHPRVFSVIGMDWRLGVVKAGGKWKVVAVLCVDFGPAIPY